MHLKFSLGICIAGLVLLASQCYSRAKTYYATEPWDGTDIHTLRGAIMAANQHGGNNIIILSKPNYEFSGFLGPIVPDELAVTNGNLTIYGFLLKKNHKSIDANSNVILVPSSLRNVFHVASGAHLTLYNLTVDKTPAYVFYAGSAIYNEGSVTIKHCIIRGNCGLTGSGIYNSGTLTMDNDMVCDNTCVNGDDYGAGIVGKGGGIYNVGKLNAKDCVISNNVSGFGQDGSSIYVGSGSAPTGQGGDAGNGGGIYNIGTMVLNRCSILSNSTGDGGNGFANLGGPFNGGAAGDGAGIYNLGNLFIKHCILAGNVCGRGGFGSAGVGVIDQNSANGGNGGSGGSGGGIFNISGATVVLFNSLIAVNANGQGGSEGVAYPGDSNGILPGSNGNPGTAGFGPDLFGDFVSTGFNLIRESDNSTGLTNNVKHDIVGSIAAPANLNQFKFR